MSLEEKINQLHITVTRVEERCKSNSHRLDDVEEQIAETVTLVTAIKELAIETKYMREDLNSTITRLNKLENRDSEKWEKFKWLLVAGIVTIILGFIATSLNLK